ncbi:MAG: N-acetylmuramic acid 6-phosphate etherase, partial [Cryomorphaceae bacterium]|nr:N-acetylmuramic acid 6-phosphate etherase [Cryomorphaceae bacterium]
VDRGIRMIMEETGVTYNEADELLKVHGSVRKAVEHFKNSAL